MVFNSILYRIDKNFLFEINGYVNVDNLRSGDAVYCSYIDIGIGEKIRSFSGRCLSVTGKLFNKRALLINSVNDVGVEYSFYIFSNRNREVLHVPLVGGKFGLKSKLLFLRHKPTVWYKLK
jgi:ribosomal protein L19